MKIYLLNLDSARYVFYSEGPETVAEDEAAAAAARSSSSSSGSRRGLRGWAERQYKRLQVLLTESEEGVGLRVRRIWERLQKRIPPDEPVLRSLRGVRALKLYHPLTLPEEETRRLWTEYLKGRQGRHTFWFVVNTLTSPLTLVFAPLPGPNVIGYWLVYRAVCHLLARLGARNARSELVTTEFHSTDALEGSFSMTDDERIASLSSSHGLTGLADFIKRITAKKAGERRKAPVAVS